MTIDNRGNIYLTGKGVTVYNPKGKKIKEISVPAGTSNVCFFGKDKNLLFITARESVYFMPMLVRSEEHTSELQSLMRNSYAVFCLKKNNPHYHNTTIT